MQHVQNFNSGNLIPAHIGYVGNAVSKWQGPVEHYLRPGAVHLQESQAKVAELESAWKLGSNELQQRLAQRDAELTAIRAEHGKLMKQVSLSCACHHV